MLLQMTCVFNHIYSAFNFLYVHVFHGSSTDKRHTHGEERNLISAWPSLTHYVIAACCAVVNLPELATYYFPRFSWWFYSGNSKFVSLPPPKMKLQSSRNLVPHGPRRCRVYRANR